jgi:hypothetical protein
MGKRHRLRQLGPREEHHELVAAESNRVGILAGDLPEEPRDEHQGFVARIVTVGVVDALEEVDVQDQERQGKVLVLIPVDLVLEVAEKKPAVVQPGELVLEDEAGGIFTDVLEKVDELAVLHRDRATPGRRTPGRLSRMIHLGRVISG